MREKVTEAYEAPGNPVGERERQAHLIGRIMGTY